MDVITGDHLNDARALNGRKRRSRSRHLDLVQLHRIESHRVVGQIDARAYAIRLGIGQGGHAQYTDEHLTSQTREQRIGPAGKLMEPQHLTLIECGLIHKYE